ncbi:hypothetical protein AURDEDRAFT_131293 [Auricularia subglabra TFB-10046 SS5]|uniref:C2H2-type domain-containing protein n=1 Tax=Auricularia subglabra (strain TFB-10046 / SS5) TaxID=717982 RepID=J0LCG1_AURST|nr:hypothetical protein AURDEDRAFT_131293 [Auricularia subglabra TFB-10046 SS5]
MFLALKPCHDAAVAHETQASRATPIGDRESCPPRLITPSPTRPLLLPLSPLPEDIARFYPDAATLTDESTHHHSVDRPNHASLEECNYNCRAPVANSGYPTGVGYVYDIESCVLTNNSPGYCDITTVPFLPCISRYLGPQHLCMGPDHGAQESQHTQTSQLPVMTSHSVMLCENCNQKFHDDALAVAHVQSHSSSHPYVCTYCHARFATQRQRDAHWVTYRGCWEQHDMNMRSKAFEVFLDLHAFTYSQLLYPHE